MVDNEPGTEQQQREKVKELVADAKICMFTTMTADGRHVSRPMALQDVEFDGDLWFFAYADSDKAQQVTLHPEVNLAFTDAKQHAWVSVSGTAEVREDRAKAEELWNPLLKATTTSAEYWESAHSSRVVTMLGFAKAAVTGKTPDAGENSTVRL